MKLLHISVAGITDKFYYPFLCMLKKKLEVEQTIFIPYQKKDISEKDMNIIKKYNSIDVKTIALPIKTSLDRILYFKKIKKYVTALEKNTCINDFQIIHAHSLFSDGGVAYLLKKKYSIPYIVAVRTTDVYVFMKYFPHLHGIGRKIIEAAEKVIFITPSLKNSTIQGLYNDNSRLLPKSKWEIIPNGVGDYWIDNKIKKGRELQNNKSVHLIQISRLNTQKNVDKTILAVQILNSRGIDVKLDILGEGELKENLEKLVRSLSLERSIYFRGFVNKPELVKEFYANNDIFIMPSEGETFGLTYIEALSQGLPIIGINGTGVSGFFENYTVGVFLDNADPREIADGIEKIMDNYSSMSIRGINSIEKFDWSLVVEQYGLLYKQFDKECI